MNNFLRLNFLDLFIVLVIYIVSQFIAGIFYLPAYIFRKDPSTLTPWASVGVYCIFFAIIYFLLLKPRNQVFKVSYSFSNFIYFPLAVVLFTSQMVITDYFTQFIPTTGAVFGKLYDLMNGALLGDFGKYPLNSFLLIVVIAPVFEELFFRGFILKGMLNNKIKPVYAILISSLIFGGVHIFPWQVAGGIFAGIILGLTYYKTGSLLTCTILHLLNNLLGYLLLLKYGSLETPEVIPDNYFSVLVAVIILLLTGGGYLILLRKKEWVPY